MLANGVRFPNLLQTLKTASPTSMPCSGAKNHQWVDRFRRKARSVIRNKKLKMKSIFSAIIFLLMGTVCTQSATIKVGKVGVRDFDTITAAIAAAATNDTISVGPGVYEESISIQKDLTIKGMAPQQVTIKAVANKDAVSVGSEAGPMLATLNIFAVTITSADGDGIRLYPGVKLFARNCIIADCANFGIRSSYNFVEAASSYSDISVKNCTIFNCGYEAINIYAWGYGTLVVEDSIFSQSNWKRPGVPYQCYFHSGPDHGTFYVNVGYILTFGREFYGAGRDINFSWPAGSVVANPQFVNPAANNFTLQTGSPAINAGTPGISRQDPDGSACDLGAFGGSESKDFWPYPLGAPFIKTITLEPNAVAQGGKITVKATATTR